MRHAIDRRLSRNGKIFLAVALTLALVFSLSADIVPLAYAHEYKQIPFKVNLVGKEVAGKWEGATINQAFLEKKIEDENTGLKKFGVQLTVEREADRTIKTKKVDDPEKQPGTDWGDVTRKDRKTLKNETLKNEVKVNGIKLFIVKRILTPVGSNNDNDITEPPYNGVCIMCNPVIFIDTFESHTLSHEISHALGVDDEEDANRDGKVDEKDKDYLNYPKADKTCKALLHPDNIKKLLNKAEERADKAYNAAQGARKDYTTTPIIPDNLNGFPIPQYIDINEVSWFTSTDSTEGAIRIYLFGIVPSEAEDLFYFVYFDIDGNGTTGIHTGPFFGSERKLVVEKSLSGWTADLIDAVSGEILMPNLMTTIQYSYETPGLEVGYPIPTPFENSTVIYVDLPTGLLEPLADNPRFGAVAVELSSGYEDFTIMEQFTRRHGPILDLSNLVGTPGSVVTASCSLFPPLTIVHLFFGPEWVYSVFTNDQGNIIVEFTIPSVSPGDYYVDAVDVEGNIAFSIYTVTSPPPSPPVGGIWIPVDKLGLLTPYIGVALTILVATAIYVKRVTRRKEKQ